MHNIESHGDIAELIGAGVRDFRKWGDVSAKLNETGDLVIFNYTAAAAAAGRWNWFERHSRGLIMDMNGNIIARPFDKFFNAGEQMPNAGTKVVAIREKMDGFLVIVYWWQGAWRAASRGSLTGPHTELATKMLANSPARKFGETSHTFLFEAIHPSTRIIVDYGTREDLVLIGGIHTETGAVINEFGLDWRAQLWGIARPHDFIDENETIVSLVNSWPGEAAEGVVLTYSDGLRLKVKSPYYVALHRAKFGLTERAVFHAETTNRLQELIDSLPVECHQPVRDLAKVIRKDLKHILAEAHQYLRDEPESDKEFALRIKEHAPERLHGLLFMLRHDKDAFRALVKIAEPRYGARLVIKGSDIRE